MNDKAKKPTKTMVKKTKKSAKHWVAVVLFAAIIVVFVFWGINPARFGENVSGVAATVNDTAISIAEFRTTVENIKQNYKAKLDMIPEEQRKMVDQQLRRQALQDLIMGEVVFQAAKSQGISPPDGEVRDFILQIPGFQENGRFLKDRYSGFLQYRNISSDEFERQVRKQLAEQKVEELFLGSATPSREEIKRNRLLSNQKLNIRYVEIKRTDLQKPAFISDGDVATFLKSHKDQVESYYKTNIIEFTKPEKVHAHHILIRVDEKRPDAQALKLATELRKQATAQNFSQLAAKNSDDPGSKAKGGDLGEFERGHMVPEFEQAAFALQSGQISEPIKTTFGYHLIYLDKKTPAGTEPLAQVQNEIARKLLLQSKEAEIVAQTKTLLQKSNKKDVDALVQKIGLKWTDSGEFDLTAPTIPKLGKADEAVDAILKRGKTTGLVPDLIRLPDGYLIVDVVSWKEAPEKAANDGSERMTAYRQSSYIMNQWTEEAEAKANVQPNAQLLAQ